MQQAEIFNILGNFLPFYPLSTQKIKILKKIEKTPKDISFSKHKWQSYDLWFLRYGVQQTEFFVILDYFLPIYPPNNLEKSKFKKNMKTLPGYIIILHRCNINDSHMMYGSWATDHDRQNLFVILDHFLPFYPPNNLKNQNIETIKKTLGDIIIWNMCNVSDNHMMYGSWDTECDRQNFLSF